MRRELNVLEMLLGIYDCHITSPARLLRKMPEVASRCGVQRYMETKLDFPGHNVSAVCADLYLGHGTTLAGIVVSAAADDCRS